MGEQNPESFNFLSLNVVFVGLVFLVIFGYLVMIIRKRWKTGFLHSKSDRKKIKKESPLL